MPSHLRLQSSFEPISAKATYQSSSPFTPPTKKQKMSLTQTYYVASTARSKLGREASKADHNLRLLVGHANLLDTLMVELADAEREQEAWFDQSVKTASKPEQPRHIRWIDSIVEEEEVLEDDESDSDDDSDDGSDLYDEDEDMPFFDIPVRRLVSPAIAISSQEIDEDDLSEDDDEEFDSEHQLTRTTSHNSPPELVHDSDSDDDSMPSSPEQSLFELSEKQRQAITTTALFESKSQHDLNNYLMQPAPQAPYIAAC